MLNKITLTCLLIASPAAAASTGPEAALAAAGSSFSALYDFKPVVSHAASVPAKPVQPPVKAAAMQFVHVSGSVTMNGNGNFTRGSAFVWVNFSGYATLTDATGRITSNNTWFNRNVGCNVSGGWVNCNDWPSWYVDFYKDGRPVGQGTVSGNLHASVYAPNGFFTATAFTSLSGDVAVSQP